MKELFTYLCNFSIVTSIAILLAIVLRPVLKKGPSFVRCILWALVFLRLLLPVGLVEVLPPVSLFDSAEEAVSTPQVEGTPVGDAVIDDNAVRDPAPLPDGQHATVQPPVNDTVPDYGNTVSVPTIEQDVPQMENEPQMENLPQSEAKTDILFALSVVWAVGVVAMLGYMLASNLLLRYRVRGAIVYDSRIRVIDRDCSPFVFGLFHPIIYIPASVNKTDWPHIIAHETSHIKRFDHVLKPLAFFVLCFYWYNPLVWVAYILLSKDIEYACDERTVKSMETDDRKAYSLALLAVSQGENIVFAPPLSFGKVSVKERIKRVMNRKIPVWAVCLAIVICASLLILVALTPSSADSEATDGSDGSSSGTELGEWTDSILYTPGVPVTYTVTVEYTDESKQTASRLLLKEWGSDKEVQCLSLPENQRFTHAPAYVADVTFDGYADLLLPNEQPAGASWYHAFVWDAQAEQLVYAPGFSQLSNVALDAGREQILSHRVSDGITSYSITAFDAGKQDFVTLHSMYLDWSNGAEAICREFDERGETVKEFTFSGTELYPENPDAAPYFEEGAVWELGSAKWETLLLDPSVVIPSDIRNVTVYYPDEDWEGYIPFTYEVNLTPEILVSLCKQHGLFPLEAEMLSFEIRDGVGYLDMNAECRSYSNTYHETIGLRAVQKTFVENYKEQIDRLVVTYAGADFYDPFLGEDDGVRYDENGNVILSDPPTYDEVLALHLQDPEHYRDPGELQPETHEMIRLENGQWYQSFVYGSYNCRCVFLSNEEVSMYAYWDFLPIGSAENAFLYNLGVMYDDPSSLVPYTERSIAVRGTLSEAPGGYAYQLQLPDELIVCLERPGNIPDWEGNAYITETDTLAIPEAYASLFEGKTGEVVVTGVVMQDGNGVFYLKDISPYLS